MKSGDAVHRLISADQAALEAEIKRMNEFVQCQLRFALAMQLLHALALVLASVVGIIFIFRFAINA